MNIMSSGFIRGRSSVLTSPDKDTGDTVPAAGSDNKKKPAGKISAASKYDTLELSREYSRNERQSRSRSADTAVPASQKPSADPQNKKAASNGKEPTGSSFNRNFKASSENTVKNGNKKVVYSWELSSYSESELKRMMTEGAITPAEYNAELNKRQSD